MTLPDVLARLAGVKACRGYWLARCPSHHDEKPSLSVREGADGRVLLKCHAGCSFEAIRYALGSHQPLRQALGLAGTSLGAKRTDAERTEYARKIWRQARPALGTPVERYLRSRGLTLPVPPSLRFHASLKHLSGVYAPAMVAAVQSREGKVVAIHRTWLRPDASGKADLEPQKAALGRIRGCAIRFLKADERLAIAEGIETALSVAQACPNLPTWCAMSASNMPAVELPEVVREIIIAADADEPGIRAARAAAQRFVLEGRRVRIAKANGGKDFNDRLRA